MDTRAEHALVDGQYAQRRASCEEAARQLGLPSLREVAFNDLDETLDRLSDNEIRARARHVVTEIERVRQTVALLRAGRLPDVGSLFNASHASMRDDFEISCAELDVAVEAATTHGALGARMTGGGFGGSAIALVPTDSTAEVTSAVTHAFADKGFGAPHCFAVTAGGARPARVLTVDLRIPTLARIFVFSSMSEGRGRTMRPCRTPRSPPEAAPPNPLSPLLPAEATGTTRLGWKTWPTSQASPIRPSHES